uniref:Poly [ADP-ribose] polymerase n=1 Tax=Neogobius melanostomus TaxID=47308 RepID=A0A8C6SDS3_9GOBI
IDALLLCIKHKLRSVAFPAIGTGNPGNVGARGVADAMFDAVIEALTKNPSSSLKSVKVVIFQNQMLQDFHDSLQQRAAAPNPSGQQEVTVSSSSAALSTALFAPALPQKAVASGGDFVMEAVKPAPLCFHICGDSTLKVNAAKKKIDSILSKNLSIIPIKDESRSAGVGIRVEAANGQGSVSVEGLDSDLLTVTTQIHEMLKAARQEEDLNQKAALLSAVVEWQYAPAGQDYKSFDAKTNYELEQALERDLKQVKVKLNGQEFTVKLPNGPVNNSGSSTPLLTRVAFSSDLPESWDSMNTSGTKAIALTPGSAEYVTVEQLFKASCNKTITKIERIQNPVLWQSLQIKRRAMDQKNGHSNNERRLFHGTSADTVEFINEHGFNRSYAGKNATAYGNGTYFAVNASYSSSDTYSRPGANGDKLMYLCSVLTGDFTTGASGMIDAPLKKSGSIDRFDSVVDNTTRPSMFIIFHDSHAYPEYLITFR